MAGSVAAEPEREVGANTTRERRQRIWIQAVVWGALIWIFAGSVVVLIRATQPSPRKVAAYLQRYRLTGRSPADRAGIIEGLIVQMNSLSYEQLGSVRESPAMRATYQLMTGAEKERFLTATARHGVRVLLDTVARLPAAERAKFMQRASDEWEARVNSDERAPFNRKRVYAALSEAFSSYYRELPPAAQAEFKPLLRRAVWLPIEGL